MIDRLIIRAAVFGMLLCSTQLAAVERYQIVHNFTAQLPTSESIHSSMAEEARIGLGAAAVHYSWEQSGNNAALDFPEQAFPITGPGTLSLWVKGDGSGNELRLVLRHGEIRVEPNGESRMVNQKDVRLDQLTLDFTDWREVTFDASKLPEDRILWWRRLEIRSGRGDDRPKAGTILLDDLRLKPQAPASEGALAVHLVGSSVRSLGDEIAIGIDARNFSTKSGTMRVRLTMVDRNQNLVTDRDFSIPIAGSTAEETRLVLEPEQLASFLPPFRITGDVISPELPHLARSIDETLVLGNGHVLYAEMGDALGQWFTGGHSIPENSGNRLKEWLMAGGQRTSPITQTSTRITREDVDAKEAAAARADNPASQPLGRYALGISYSGEAVVYRGADRYIPGNAFSVGMWVKGDDSGSQLVACFLDYSDLSDFWHGGWKRQYEERPLCTLDFSGWRYVEVDLPGNGRGTNLLKGSTPDIDFPIELTALKVVPTDEEASGSLQVGAIYAKTQLATADTLAVHLAYDDAEQRYGDGHGAWLVVHNGALSTHRSVAGRWDLLDRSEQLVASGRFTGDLAPGASSWQRLDLGGDAAAAVGPLTIRTTVSDTRDATVSATRAMVISKPDSIALHADFESDRGYLGLKADGIEAPKDGVPVAFTSTDQAHGGEQSLAIPWAKDGQRAAYVAIDPELAGVPTEVSMWVHGDGSGALFHPVIGDRSGIAHGVEMRRFDLFLPRVDGPLQNAVRVDWQGWREVTFRLPPVSEDWNVELPVLPYLASYPLGLHLAVDGTDATSPSGTVYIDDIKVTTHLDHDARVTMSTMRDGLPNFVQPGTVLRVRVANADRNQRRSVRLTGGAYNAAGRTIAAPPAGDIELAPGEIRLVELSPAIPAGAYAVRIELMAAGRSVAANEEDLIVGDPVPFLGGAWRQAMADEFALRMPLGDPVVMVDEDWDWVEFYPGNFQLDTMRGRSARIAETGMSPWMLLGYSAYWAAGIGLQQLESGSFERARRGPGHGVDIFLVPEREAHWRDYVAEVMRGVGKQVGGFVLWDNPDGTSSLAVPPAKLARFLSETDHWRRIYCPETPLIIGGMAQATALPYLSELADHGALDHMGGVNVRFDLGRLSPEDAQVADFARSVLRVIDPDGDRDPLLYFTDLDWAVERSQDGMDAFMQAAYLVRSDLVMRPFGVSPALTVRNGDASRVGLGLAYRPTVQAPPMNVQRAEHLIKPGWWAMARIRRLFSESEVVGDGEIADVVPGRTRCLLMRRETDGKGILLVWRNDDRGRVSLGDLTVAVAEDCFGGTVAAADGWYPVGADPLVLSLDESAEVVASQLALLRVKDAEQASWPQRPVAVIEPVAGGPYAFRHSGGESVMLDGITADGRKRAWPGLRYPNGGEEAFRVEVPPGCALVLRHRYQLENGGFIARVAVDGTSIGDWNLQHAEPELSEGLREAVFVIPAESIAGKPVVEISLSYTGAATSGAWMVFAYEDGAFPLSALGPIHADQAVGRPRLARNLIGGPLKVGTQAYANGVAVHANSLLEYPINRQFSRFRAEVGVDSAADGRGSVVFEIWTDGEKRWASPVMSGLDEARSVDIDVSGVDRLRLVLRDGGDGNRLDAGNWCDAELER